MGKLSVFDAVDVCPRHIIGGQGRVVDWPMDGASRKRCSARSSLLQDCYFRRHRRRHIELSSLGALKRLAVKLDLVLAPLG